MPAAHRSMASILLRPTAHSGPLIVGMSWGVICREAGSGYFDGSPEDMDENWQEEWFYLLDAPLTDPPQVGLVTPFSPAPPKKWYSWHPLMRSEIHSPSVIRLADQVTQLRHGYLTLPSVMAVALSRGIQPLQQWVHPMWEFNGASDSTRAIRGIFHESVPLKRCSQPCSRVRHQIWPGNHGSTTSPRISPSKQ